MGRITRIQQTDDVGFAGKVHLEEVGDDGQILSQQQSNAITYSLRNQVVNFLTGGTTITPAYIAIGAANAALEGIATAASSTTLSDTSKSWGNNEHSGKSVEILLGTGASQVRAVSTNTTSQLTVSPAWTTTPDTTSRYRIIESTDIRTWTKLPLELERKQLEDKRADSDSASLLSIFRKGEAGGNWAQAMLTDQAATYVTVHACDQTTNWDNPGTGSTLSLDTSTRQEGTGSLRVDITGTSSGTVAYRNASLVVDGSAVTEADGRYTFWLFISDISKVSGSLTAELSSSTTNDSNEYQWAIPTSSLVSGWNYVSLRLVDASKTGSPDLSAIVRVRLLIPYNANSNGSILRLDRIKLFQHAGTPLAVIEFDPSFAKAADSVVNVRWNLQLQFSARKNTMLWNGISAEAVVADVTRNLTETGSGTYTAIGTADPHPWRWATHWVPASGGYQTVGGESLDPGEGTVAMWSRYAPSGTGAPAADSVLVDWRYDANNRITLKRNSGGTGFIGEYVKAGVTKSISVTDAYVADDWRFITFSWDSRELAMSVSDSDNASATAKSTQAITSTDRIHGNTADITLGGGASLTSTNIRLGPVLFFSKSLANTEIDSLFKLGRPYFYKET